MQHPLWTKPTSSRGPVYPTPTFVRATGLEQRPGVAQAAADGTGDKGREVASWYEAFSARDSPAGTPSAGAAGTGTHAGDEVKLGEDDDDDDDEVLWIPLDEDGADSDIEFIPPPSAPPASSPLAAQAGAASPALAPPLPPANPRPAPSYLPRPAAVALPAPPVGTNHFLPFSPPDDPVRAPSAKGSKLVDLLVLPAADAAKPAFQPPAYFALGPSNKGHQMLRKAGWDGHALGLAASAPAITHDDAGEADDDEPPAASSLSRIAPIATSLLPAQRGLSSALLAHKRVTHSHEHIEAARKRSRAELARSIPSAKERARQEKRERETRKALAAELNAD